MSEFDESFEEELRARLSSAASTVEVDTAAWRTLNARIRRRQAVVRGGGLALAGGLAALVAVTVLPGSQDPRVELAPGAVASDGAVASEGPVAPTPSADPAPGAIASDAGGILYSDGDSIYVAGLDGAIRFTPAQGEGTSIITDLAVLPGGAVDDLTMAYRYDVTVDDDDCGDISWTRVVGPDNNVAGGGLPGVSTSQTGDCLGAPVFTSDGSALAWLAELGDGGVALQTLDWTPEGPAEGSLTTFPLQLDGLPDAELVHWDLSVPPPPADVAASGTVAIRATADGVVGLYELPVERQADGALALPNPSTPTPAGPDPVVGGAPFDRAARWSAVALPTQDAEPVVGLVVQPQTSASEAPPRTAETDLHLAQDATPFLDVIGDTALVGVGGPMRLAIADGGGIAIRQDLPVATAAALLLPGPVPVDGEAPASDPAVTDPDDPTATDLPEPAGPLPSPSPAPASEPATAPTEPVGEAPGAVTQTAAAIRAAAQARDWDAVGALIPSSGFTSNFGGQTDHIAFYRQEEANGIDVLGTLVGLLAEPAAQGEGGLWVWPREFLQDGYLGYRVGIAEDGTWRFYVAGD